MMFMYEPNEYTSGAEFQQPPFPGQPAPPPGKGIIKVAGILLIIFGSLGLLASLILLPLLFWIAEMSERLLDLSDYFNTQLIIPLIILGMVFLVCEIVFGIIGLRNAGNLAKTQLVINMGIILCALNVIGMIMSVIMFGPAWISPDIGVAFPILFIVGGYKNKKSLQS